jgi:hypothetical protein
MAAHEGSDHAEHAERRDIGEASLEQLQADIVRISREYMTAQPFPVFQEMRRVRSRIYAALDRQLWPRDQTGLYFDLACINCLMTIAAKALSYPQAAEELVRAAWAYATGIDHRPLMARLRLEASTSPIGIIGPGKHATWPQAGSATFPLGRMPLFSISNMPEQQRA